MWLTQEAIKKFGPRLRAMRESAGLSVGQVCKLAVFMERRYLQDIEDGVRAMVTADTIEMLLSLYRGTMTDLESTPMTFETSDEAVDAFLSGKLSDDEFMRWMRVDQHISVQKQVREL